MRVLLRLVGSGDTQVLVQNGLQDEYRGLLIDHRAMLSGAQCGLSQLSVRTHRGESLINHADLRWLYLGWIMVGVPRRFETFAQIVRPTACLSGAPSLTAIEQQGQTNEHMVNPMP